MSSAPAMPSTMVQNTTGPIVMVPSFNLFGSEAFGKFVSYFLYPEVERKVSWRLPTPPFVAYWNFVNLLSRCFDFSSVDSD